jgi:AAA domain
MNITSGPIARPTKLLIYGVEGIGKTTLISKLKQLGVRPLFLDTEAGTLDVDCQRTPVTKFAELETTVTEFIQDDQFNALVVDTVTSLEPIVEAAILERTKKKRMADFEYGKGSVLLREEFDRLLLLVFDPVIAAGKHVIFIGHSEVQRTQLPELIEGFDRYQVALDKRVSATLRQWADHVFFANWDYAVVENSKDEARGVQGKGRALYTTHTAAFDAKNRAGLSDKLEWKVESLTPLFKPGKAPLAERWDEFVKAFGTPDPTNLFRFLRSRFPTFNEGNFSVVPANYVKGALNRPDEFRSAINEFIGETPQTVETQPAAPVES